MRKKLIWGAAGLLLLNLLIFGLTYRGGQEEPCPCLQREEKEVKNTLIINRQEGSVELRFFPAKPQSPAPALKKVDLRLTFTGGELEGKSPEGTLLGSRVILRSFTGTLCGWKVESKQVVINLSSPHRITFQKFLMEGKRGEFRGISTSPFDIRKLCRFLKGERKLPR